MVEQTDFSERDRANTVTISQRKNDNHQYPCRSIGYKLEIVVGGGSFGLVWKATV